MDKSFHAENPALRDPLLLAARILLTWLFISFGWQKLTGFAGTVAYFSQVGVPLPDLAAVIAIIMEFGVGLAILFGALTRPLALLLGLYTIATALLGHEFWTMSGAARLDNEIHFFKNLGIMGGFILLYLTGAGRYSIDRNIGLDGAPRLHATSDGETGPAIGTITRPAAE
jgi:putative oxidoreductase